MTIHCTFCDQCGVRTEARTGGWKTFCRTRVARPLNCMPSTGARLPCPWRGHAPRKFDRRGRTPRAHRSRNPVAPTRTCRHSRESIGSFVFRTGFLPLENSQAGATYEQSGLSSRTQEVGKTSLTIRHLPTFESVGRPARPFVSDILAGFEWVGRQTFEGHSGRLPFSERLLELKNSPRRRIIRSTAQYRAAIEKLVEPQALRTQQWD